MGFCYQTTILGHEFKTVCIRTPGAELLNDCTLERMSSVELLFLKKNVALMRNSEVALFLYTLYSRNFIATI